MPAIGLDATGRVKGIPVDIGAGIVKTPTGKAILLLGIVASARAEVHKPVLAEILGSSKPL